MTSASDDISLSSDQDTNWFLHKLNPIQKFENFVSNYIRIYIPTFMNIPHFLGEKSLNDKDINKKKT